MKIPISKGFAVASLLCGAVLAISAALQGQIGRPVSDAEAATLRGAGCSGVTTSTCYQCSDTVVVGGSEKDSQQRPTGSSTCCVGPTQCFFRPTHCYN